MTSPIQNVQPRSDDGGCLWLILLTIIAGIGYGIYELYLTYPTLMIIIGIVLFLSAAILLWINLDVPLWTILGMSIGIFVISMIMYFFQIELLIIGGVIIGLLLLLSFFQMSYYRETQIYIIVIMVAITIAASVVLYFYFNLFTAVISYVILLIFFFFVTDWIEDILDQYWR